MKSILLAIILGVLASAGNAQSLQVVGYSGHLGEWELTATVTEAVSGYIIREYSGPLTMKHVGLCTQDGPEERVGEMRLRMSVLAAQLSATFSFSGIECTYIGRLSDDYTGTMNCPDRQPVPLKLWVK